MQEYIIKSVEELFNRIIEMNRSNECWFRGQNNARYGLSPSAYRHVYLVADNAGRPFEPTEIHFFNNHGGQIFLPTDIYYDSFIKKSDSYGIAINKNEWLANLTIGQHYGLPTPLLDWSTDATIGLFFAIDGKVAASDCSLFVLNPRKMNAYFMGQEVVFSQRAVQEHLDHEQHMDYAPIAFIAEKLSKRVCRQSGNFTLYGENIWPIDHYPETDNFLTKLIIPSNVAEELQSKLKALGITKDSIYVEADKRDEICKEVKRDSKKDLMLKLAEFRKIWLSVPESQRNNTVPNSYLI